jgi:5'-3' exoribonuclease 1
MGIPGFFGFIKKNKTIIQAKLEPTTRQHLFLDFNGTVYTVLKKNTITTEESLIINVLAYLDTITRIYPHLITLYIGIDGVPPRSKIEQQRTRRFNNVNSNTPRDPPSTATTSSIDTNMITPGTAFMTNLCNRIKLHVIEEPLYSTINVIFSGVDVPLEGEHKIFKYIREHAVEYNTQTDQIIIYGLDADLIMLSIAAHVPNIYLLREKTEYGQYAMVFEGHEFLYLDIDLLKECIIQEFECHLGDIQPQEIIQFLDDYVFICFLLGNDFVPKVPWLSIKNGGHEILMTAYSQMYNMHYLHIFDGQYAKVNHKAFYYLIEILQNMEDTEMIELYKRRMRAKPDMRRVTNEEERQKQLAAQMPLLHLDVELGIQYDRPYWRNQYYPTCFHQRPTKANIENIVIQYLESLIWTARYYYKDIPSWSWFYPFHYAPSFRDTFTFLKLMEETHSLNGIAKSSWYWTILGNNINNIAFDKHKPIKPLELLLMVLPVKSSIHLPAGIQNILTPHITVPELIKYFPNKYDVSVAFHTFTWECRPLIPVIDYNDIRESYKKVHLTQTEKNRNTIGSVFTKLPG